MWTSVNPVKSVLEWSDTKHNRVCKAILRPLFSDSVLRGKYDDWAQSSNEIGWLVNNHETGATLFSATESERGLRTTQKASFKANMKTMKFHDSKSHGIS